mgnify:CR=1 FL=1
MARQNTGYARMKVLTVTKGDYTQSYDITQPWTDPTSNNYPMSVTADTIADLDDGDYEELRDRFIAYVCSMEPGLSTDCPDLTEGSVVWDPQTCPITLETADEQWAE